MVQHGKRQGHAHKAMEARQFPQLSVPIGAASPISTLGTTPGGAAASPFTGLAPPPPSTAPVPAPAPPPTQQTTTITSTSTQSPVDTRPVTPSVVVVVDTSTSTPPTRVVTRTSTTPSSSTQAPSTSYNVIYQSVSAPTLSVPTPILAAASATGSSNNDGSSTGTIIGAVAGALVGVVVLSGLIGYLFRAKFGKKNTDDDDDPFARDFRRNSVRLPEDDYDHMSQISAGRSNDIHRGIGRSDTLQSGAHGQARPDTFMQRHNDYHGAMQPSFQPGQIINKGQYYGNTGFPQGQERIVGDAGGWGVAASYGGQGYGHVVDEYAGASGAQLSRQGTERSEYSTYESTQRHDPFATQHGLSGLNEEDEEEELPSRSGTPVDPNPQSAYYAHGSRNGSTDQASPARDRGFRSHRMSVRNGGLDAHDDAYGGM